MKTHYAQCDRANESDNNEYWSNTSCGLKETESDLTENIKEVTCKNCLKVMYTKRRLNHTKPIKLYEEIF